MVDVIHHMKEFLTCEGCDEKVEIAWELDLHGENIILCGLCLAHKFGTNEAVIFMKMNKECSHNRRHF